MIQDGKSVTNCADQRADSDPVKRRDLAPSPDSYQEVCKASVSRRGSTDRFRNEEPSATCVEVEEKQGTCVEVEEKQVLTRKLHWITHSRNN